MHLMPKFGLTIREVKRIFPQARALKIIFKKYGLFDENLRSRSDREMWWRLFGKDESEKPKISSYFFIIYNETFISSLS